MMAVSELEGSQVWQEKEEAGCRQVMVMTNWTCAQDKVILGQIGIC